MKQKALGLSPHTEMGSSEHLMRYGYVVYLMFTLSIQHKRRSAAVRTQHSVLSTQRGPPATTGHM